jgi:hypothetical protein
VPLVSLSIVPDLQRRVREKFARNAVSQSLLVESLSGIQTLKAMAVEPQVRDRWDRQLAAYIGASLRVVTLASGGSQVISLINKLTTAAFFDMQNNGERVHTGWVTAGEGLLVFDPHGSNSVTGDRDLVAGFDALKELAMIAGNQNSLPITLAAGQRASGARRHCERSEAIQWTPRTGLLRRKCSSQ